MAKTEKDMCVMQDFDFFDQIADEARHFDNQGEIFLCGD